MKSKINLGEQLVSDNIIVKPIKKNLWVSLLVLLWQKRRKKIEVCFDVLANKLAKSGNHKIYMRFFSPEGVVIFDKVVGSRITMNPELKTEMLFTIFEELEYSNEKKNVCIEWDTLIKYKSGAPYR